jgi:AraC-like DNA-binding protein
VKRKDVAVHSLASATAAMRNTDHQSPGPTDEQWRKSCPAMAVACLAYTPNGCLDQTDDAIEIIIPADEAVFEATFLLPGGRWQKGLVRGPYVCLIPPNYKHRLSTDRYGEMIVLALSASFYRERVRTALGIEPPDIELQYAVADPFVRELGNALRSEFHVHRLPAELYLESLASVIAVHVADRYGRDQGTRLAATGLAAPKFNRVVAFIMEHLAETLRVGDLAAAVHMSECHFARAFKQAAGQSPHVYITARRVARAKELLRNTDLPLVEVAACTGFQSQAHFTGVFRKYSGATPRVYRVKGQADRVRD